MSTPAATTADVAAPLRARSSARRRPDLLDAIVWETNKLAAQLRTRATLALCLVGPVITVLVINAQQRPPKDSLFGRYFHASGFADPLLVLGFASQWVLPLVTAIVAGDIFASEDHYGTWKTVLTRAASRTQLFWAKTITAMGFALIALVVMAASTIVSSLLIVGHQDLTGLSGQVIGAGSALRLVVASWATVLPPLLGFTCLALLLSVWSRNPAFGIAAPIVIGLVMQLTGTLGGVEPIRPVLLTTPFEAWHGLLTAPHFYGPLVWGVAASTVWAAVCLTVAFFILRRRDITED
jgi:ABC-2 type transport system permease protein